jgi:hypothetical protein
MTRKIAVALAFVASVSTANVSQAAPVVTNTSAIKAAAFSGVTKIQWQWCSRGRSVGCAPLRRLWLLRWVRLWLPVRLLWRTSMERRPHWGRYPDYGGWRRTYWRERYWGPPRAYW